MINARSFDYEHPFEKYITNEIGSEGVVVFTHEIEWSDKIERQLIAVIPSEDGPQIVCCQVWPAAWGDPIVRVSAPLPVAVACSKHVPASLLHELEDRFPDSRSVLGAIHGRPMELWRTANSKDTAYLLRVTGPDGDKRLAIATSHGDRRIPDEAWTATIHLDVGVEEFKSWVDQEFGHSFKPR